MTTRHVFKQLNFISTEIKKNKIVHLVRYRSYDLAKHEFLFERIQAGEEPYLVTERFKGDTVSEDYHDHDTVIILCRWLIQLNFELKIYKLGEFPTDIIN